MQNNIFVICGPTSTGKTSLAISLCEQFNGVIISADSRQIYKEMNIGTGKVPINSDLEIGKFDDYWKLNDVLTYGYDLVYPNEFFSAYDYYQFAVKSIKNEIEKKKTIFIVGGTGFYIDVVTQRRPMSGTKPDLKKRDELEKKSVEELTILLESLNVKRAETIDKQNKRRLIRAIEVELGEKINEDQLDTIPNAKFHYIELTASRDVLYDKVDAWVDVIWQNGLLQETKQLMKKYPNSDKLNGLVYRNAVEFLRNEVDEAESIQKAKYDLHKYIRRQQTWFKQYEDAVKFDITNKTFYEDASNLLQSTVQT